MTEPELIRACRGALGLTAAELASALLLSDGRVIRFWESSQRSVPGPAWVAIGYMLREALPAEAAAPLVAEIEGLRSSPHCGEIVGKDAKTGRNPSL